MARAAACLLALALLVVGCRREETDWGKRPRFPDDRGAVSNIDFERVELDGKRRHPIHPEIQSFSTYTGEPQALLSWNQKYVHVGLDGDDKVIWIAGIGVIDRSVDPPVVRYTNGLLRSVDKRSVVFADGTVLTVVKDVRIPAVGNRLNARIDPQSHLVTDLRGTAE